MVGNYWKPIDIATLLAQLETRARKAFDGKVVDLRRHHQAILTNTRGARWTRDGFKASWSDELNRPV
jgi:hypothetical protein